MGVGHLALGTRNSDLGIGMRKDGKASRLSGSWLRRFVQVPPPEKLGKQTHFIKENENAIANKLGGPRHPPPASKIISYVQS